MEDKAPRVNAEDNPVFSNLLIIYILSSVFRNLFIAFEVSAQVLLTSTLLKFKKEFINYINPMILKIKIIFVTVVILATVIIFTYLLQGDLKSSTKHLLEWNYFSILLLYYFL